MMTELFPVVHTDLAEVEEFLTIADLTKTGLTDPSVLLWIGRDHEGGLAGLTGLEFDDRERPGAALIRSVAVAPNLRRSGLGRRLANHALGIAARAGARRAWCFSRRSGPFWTTLGFDRADPMELARALPDTAQVRGFAESGQLATEQAWTRGLSDFCQVLGRPRP